MILVCYFRTVVQNDDDSDDENHAFLKRICSILTLLGQTQLAVLWVSTISDQLGPVFMSVGPRQHFATTCNTVSYIELCRSTRGGNGSLDHILYQY